MSSFNRRNTGDGSVDTQMFDIQSALDQLTSVIGKADSGLLANARIVTVETDASGSGSREFPFTLQAIILAESDFGAFIGTVSYGGVGTKVLTVSGPTDFTFHFLVL